MLVTGALSSIPANPTGGAFDWAGGTGPTLRLDQVYAGLREEHPEAVIQAALAGAGRPRGLAFELITQRHPDWVFHLAPPVRDRALRR